MNFLPNDTLAGYARTAVGLGARMASSPADRPSRIPLLTATPPVRTAWTQPRPATSGPTDNLTPIEERTTVSTRSYVGIPDPDQPGQVRLHYVHSDGTPGYMIPTLRAIWAKAAERDTSRLAARLLAYDWDYLDPDTNANSEPPFNGEQLIPGVGMTLSSYDIAAQVPLPPEPVTVIALAATGDLDAPWIYLLNPGTDTITVHTSGGDVVGTEPLAS